MGKEGRGGRGGGEGGKRGGEGGRDGQGGGEKECGGDRHIRHIREIEEELSSIYINTTQVHVRNALLINPLL